MKRHIFAIATVILAVLLVSCTENRSVTDIKGSYSYKTSGTVLVGQESVSLSDESGQMEVVSMHDGDSILLTMNQVTGSVYNTTGAIDSYQDIVIRPFKRRITLTFDTTRLITFPVSEEFNVTVSGTGHRYDNTIILNLKYKGTSAESGHSFTSEKVTMIAKRN